MPLEFWVRRIGEALHPITDDDKAKCMEMTEGQTIDISVTMPRSQSHHKFFFAAIADACANWPETHRFQPDSPEHLRAWLLCQANHRNTTKHIIEDGCDPKILADLIEASIKQSGGYGFVAHTSEFIAVLTAKSIAWAKLDQKQFNQISNDVSAILAKEIQLTLDDFKQQAGQAA